MITLLTDFGTADYFVPAVKGVIWSLQPNVQIVDLTHEIPAQDIHAGAFTLGACYHNFPPGTIHVAVVDPGVGSARRPIVVQAGQHFFVGPDNGLFSFVYARAAAVQVFYATQPEFFRLQPSPTFHGRDVFAPLAAWLARGVQPASFGPTIQDYARFDLPQPQFDSTTGQGRGRILHLDRFGNCITNLRVEAWPALASLTLPPSSEPLVVTQFGTHFDAAADKSKLFAYPGSAGYWEIALWCASAAAAFGLTRGAEVLFEPAPRVSARF